MSIQLSPQRDERPNIVIFDIDGCCLDSDSRLPHLLQGDRPTYDALHETDKEIYPVSHLYKMLLQAPGIVCIFITSRSECARDYTSRQLSALFSEAFVPTNLLMRPIGENDTPDAVLKPRLAFERKGIEPKDILFVIEDRDSMVAEWRRLGVTVLQPALNPTAG